MSIAAVAVLGAGYETDALGQWGPSGWLEIVAVVTYGLSVWLAVQNSIGTWWTGIVASGIYVVIFWQQRLFADTGLQLVFVAVSVWGLVAWWRRGGEPDEQRARRASIAALGVVLLCIAVGTYVVREWLLTVGGSAPFWDALLTSASLAALFLLIQRRMVTWYLWIAIDAAYVVLFVTRGLYLSAILYGILLLMAVQAAISWRAMLTPATSTVDL